MHWYSCISYYSDASISYKGARNSSYIPIHMLQRLSWPKLQTRCKISRLQIFHKILHNDIPISIPSNYLPMARETRQFHQHHFILPLSSTTAYQRSFFSRTVQEWNSLPQSFIDLNFDSFTANISNYYNVYA